MSRKLHHLATYVADHGELGSIVVTSNKPAPCCAQASECRNDPLEGLVICFSTVAKPENAARMHAAGCPAARAARTRKLIVDDVRATFDDLNERGFYVKRCRCCT